MQSGLSVEKFFGRYHKILVKYLRDHLFDKSEAEDLAQEVYYRIIRSPGADRVRHPKAYLLKVAKNLLSDHFRYRSRHGIDGQLVIDEIGEDAQDTAPSPERELLSERELAEVGASLGELSERCQAVFVMHKIDGISYKVLLGQPENQLPHCRMALGLFPSTLGPESLVFGNNPIFATLVPIIFSGLPGLVLLRRVR